MTFLFGSLLVLSLRCKPCRSVYVPTSFEQGCQSEHTNTDGINKVVGHLNSGLRQIIPHCNTIMTGGQLAQVRVYKLNKEQ